MKIIIAVLVLIMLFVGYFELNPNLNLNISSDKSKVSSPNIPNDFSAINNQIKTSYNNETQLDKSLDNPIKLKYTENGYSSYGYSLLNNTLKDVYVDFTNAIFTLTKTFTTKKTSIENISSVIMAIERDFPVLFWLDNEYQYKASEDNSYLTIKLNYKYERAEIESKLSAINKAANDILINIPEKLDDYGKAKIIYDIVISNISYDLNAINQREVYGGLIDKKATCIGYAKTFQYLMEHLNIQTLIVYGDAGEAHSWNIILIDGEYYHVDPTWGKKNIINHGEYKTNEFFLVNDNQISVTHTKVDSRNYLIPSCNSTKNNFFVKNDLIIDRIDENVISSVVKKAMNISLYSNNNVLEFGFSSSNLAQEANELNKKSRIIDKQIFSVLSSNYNKKVIGIQYNSGSNIMSYIID